MTSAISHKLRKFGASQAAAILYGDWGTSKAYAIGLAFAIAGYSSFWLILAIGFLMTLVAINYVTICKFSLSSATLEKSAKSQTLNLISTFFSLSDYAILIPLSTLSCFSYLEFSHPQYWAMGSIVLVGFINYFGPRHAGNLALIIAIAVVIVVATLVAIAFPYIGEAISHIQPLKGGFFKNWERFVTIIVALSGIQGITNMIGAMKLDANSTALNPSIDKKSKKYLIAVIIEICFTTVFFGLVVNAIPGLQLVEGDVHAPDQASVRDSMLRYMGNFFASHSLNPAWGSAFGMVVGFAFAILLLSAANTAILALISFLFTMSRNGEVPASFQRMNYFGVPILPLIFATAVPIVVLIFVHDMASLANLYAVGFVGAIATNLGMHAFDRSIPMTRSERYLMGITFLIMAAIEITLFITKPEARRFAISMLTGGLILRAFVLEQRQKKLADKEIKRASIYTDDIRAPLHYGAMLCAVRSIGKTLNFALQEAKHYEQPLYILFVRNQKFLTEEDRTRLWIDDEEACKIFDYAKESSHEMTLKFLYVVSDDPAQTIVNTAKQLRVSRLIVGRPRQSPVMHLLRGNVIQEISHMLPNEIDLLVIS
jgi:amino acid transporter